MVSRDISLINNVIPSYVKHSFMVKQRLESNRGGNVTKYVIKLQGHVHQITFL